MLKIDATFSPGQQRLRRARDRFDQMVEFLNHPHAELTIEVFGPFLATFEQLHRSGCSFDPALIALMKVLKRQAFEVEAEMGGG